MNRRAIVMAGFALPFASAVRAATNGERLATASRRQVGVTVEYDPRYVRLAYPSGDVPRVTGVCADVVVRAGRDGLGLDLQTLIHEDMGRAFGAYPRKWGLRAPDSNIDHRRVENQETYWLRSGAELWRASRRTAGDAFPGRLEVGDILTWRLVPHLPHVAIVIDPKARLIVHNIGGGAQMEPLWRLAPHAAFGHYRWPSA